MKVYPNNAIRRNSLHSPSLANHSRITDLLENTLDIPVHFERGDASITGSLHTAVKEASVILGKCDYRYAEIRLFAPGDSEPAEVIGFPVTGKLEIIRAISSRAFTRFSLYMSSGISGNGLGYLYIGEEWKLPRFTVTPAAGVSIFVNSARTFTGQARGFPAKTLRNFTAQFAHNETYCIETDGGPRSFDDYATLVQTTEAHVIDPYYERPKENGFHNGVEWEKEAFPPMLATLAEMGRKEKRPFNGFYWNTRARWMEAR